MTTTKIRLTGTITIGETSIDLAVEDNGTSVSTEITRADGAYLSAAEAEQLLADAGFDDEDTVHPHLEFVAKALRCLAEYGD